MLGNANDSFHHIWEAAATATALLKGMIDLCRHDEVPGIGFQKVDDRLLDLLLGYQVTVTYKHFWPWWLTALSGAVRRGLRGQSSRMGTWRPSSSRLFMREQAG
jgi:hypothetical protein